jgi:hypothetical protein
VKKLILVLLVSALGNGLVFGQAVLIENQDRVNSNKVGGFRVGITYISALDNKEGNELKTVMKKEKVGQLITQFGWQFEHQFLADNSRNGAISEMIFMAGGMDQGAFIPSASWLIGFRLGNGFEFGGGPNISITKNRGGELKLSPAFAWGTGYSCKVGNICFPVNLAIVQTRGSVRTSFLTGFIFK